MHIKELSANREMPAVVQFLAHTWQEIPELENPAMKYSNVYENDELPNNSECVMVFKGNKEAYRIRDGGFVVAHVPKEGDIIKLAVFWQSGLAISFAKSFSATIDLG